MSDILRVTDPILSTADAVDDMNRVLGSEPGTAGEITDATARTIASWWQSPGTVGHVLAALASGRSVTASTLLADISRTAREARLPGWTDNPRTRDRIDTDSLNLLSTWALNHE